MIPRSLLKSSKAVLPSGTTVNIIVPGRWGLRALRGFLWRQGEPSTVVAYVSLNPVRAGLCEDPKDYRYCGYAEAVARGTPEAMEGIRIVLGLPPETSIEELAREYRNFGNI